MDAEYIGRTGVAFRILGADYTGQPFAMTKASFCSPLADITLNDWLIGIGFGISILEKILDIMA